MLESLRGKFRAAAPAVDFCALRFVEETSEYLAIRQDVAEPPQLAVSRGAMVTVIDKGGLGYAATSDLSDAGIREALDRARDYAKLTAGRSVVDYASVDLPDRKSTRLNSSHTVISYAVFCLKKKKSIKLKYPPPPATT